MNFDRSSDPKQERPEVKIPVDVTCRNNSNLNHEGSRIGATAELLKSILLPESFAGIGAKYTPALPRFARPANNCWFRVHPGISFDVLTFKVQDGGRLVAVPTNDELLKFLASRNEIRPTRSYAYVYNDGTIGFWPVVLDGINGRPLDSWNQSAHLIAEQAKCSWCAVISGRQSYQVAHAPNDGLYGNPRWPDDLNGQFGRAIEGVLVRDLDHPEMRKWRGLQ